VATNADVGINIVTQFTGKGKFKQAEDSLTRLNRQVKGLAKSYVGLYGAQKLYSYGKESLKAFVADDKAARQLTQTVTNLGLAYEATNVENFVQGLEKTYAVADDLLRPSMAKLLQVTQSVTKSQEIMRTALNASSGAGVDLGTAVTDLSQAYVGNLRGLRKYNLGLTQAELSTMTFQQIQEKLNNTFTGQAALAVDTYAGKMDALTIASGNAKEIIGKGLTDAITSAFGGGDIDKATTNIESMGQVVADIVAGLGIMTNSVVELIAKTDRFTVGRFLQNRSESNKAKTPYDPMSAVNPGLTPEFMKLFKERQKADAAAAKRQKELAAAALALAKKQTKELKQQTALQKAKTTLGKTSAVFDMDLIQNTAALKGKLTDEETLKLKLQQAILTDNAKVAGELSQELLGIQIDSMIMNNLDPFGSFTQGAAAALAEMIKLRKEIGNLSKPVLTAGEQLLATDYAAAIIDETDPDIIEMEKEIAAGMAALSNLPRGGMGSAASRGGVNGGYASQNTSLTPTEIRIYLDPLAAAAGVTTAVIDNAANGNSNGYSPERSFAGR
jgi:hypothetical protein